MSWKASLLLLSALLVLLLMLMLLFIYLFNVIIIVAIIIIKQEGTRAHPQLVGRQILNLCLLLQASVANCPADPFGKALPNLVAGRI